jgi:hypothetical protein
MTRESRDVWRERVERWRKSGQSAQEFAAAMGFNVWTLRKWGDRLRREGAGERSVNADRSATARRAPASKRAAPPLAFVEVLASSAATSPAGQLFEIVLRSGVIVRVPARFEPQALQQVLAAAQSR